MKKMLARWIAGRNGLLAATPSDRAMPAWTREYRPPDYSTLVEASYGEIPL